MPLNKDWRELLELLNSNGVEYLVVGAFAVAYHGFPRYRADLDLPVRPTRNKAELDVVATNFIVRAASVCNKEQTGRAKDLGDTEELQKRIGKQND